MKRDKKGISAVVETMLIILLTVVGVGVLWVVVERTTDEAVSGQSPDCFTLNLEPIKCGYGNGCYQFSSTQQVNLPNMVWISPLRRNEGDGELESVMLVVKDSSGSDVAVSAINHPIPELRYNFKRDLSGLKELETTEVGAIFSTWSVGVVPIEVRVAAVVKGGIICPARSYSVPCVSLESIGIPTCQII